jgi:antitoxin StbD
MTIQALHADFAISMSDFKKNPGKAALEQPGQTLAVLNRNTPAFYVVPPGLYEAMLDQLDEAKVAPLVHQRMNTNNRVKVTLADL